MTSSAESLPHDPEPPVPPRPSDISVTALPGAPRTSATRAGRERARRVRNAEVDLAELRRTAGGEPVVVTSRPRWWVSLALAGLFVGTLAVGGVAVERGVRNARDRSRAEEARVPATGTVVADTPMTAALTVTVAAVPTLPGGATSLFDPGAAAALAPLLEQAVGDRPVPFTSIIVLADAAITTTRDPADPMRTVRTTWRPSGATTEAPEPVGVDITQAMFGVADVDWEVIPALVAAAPDLTGLVGRTVTQVVIQRWGFDPAFPMRVLVYVDGGMFVEATMDGEVVAVH